MMIPAETDRNEGQGRRGKREVWVVNKEGTGKEELTEGLVAEDASSGEGFGKEGDEEGHGDLRKRRRIDERERPSERGKRGTHLEAVEEEWVALPEENDNNHISVQLC
jgi:hypothetical protein